MLGMDLTAIFIVFSTLTYSINYMTLIIIFWMETYIAERSEILRGSQKDDEFLNDLQQKISDLIKRIGNDSLWIRAYKYFEPFTRLVYYTSTSLQGAQTLGEEYLGLIQVNDQSNVQLSTIWQRLFWVALESSGPLLLEQKLKQWKQLDELYYQRRSFTSKVPVLRIIASALLRHLTFGIIQRLHLAVFYIFSSNFYSIWKRFVNIKYVTIRPQTDIKMNLIFKIIGASYLIQFLLSVIVSARRDVLRNMALRSEENKNGVSNQDSNFYCDICLNSDDPVSTPCGHVYCFNCILFHSEHAGLDSSIAQCPKCRFQFELRTIVPLLNL